MEAGLARDLRATAEIPRRWYVTPFIVLVLGAASLVLLISTQTLTERQTVQEFLLDNAIAKIEVTVATSHLWLEESLTGDESIDVETIWSDLDQATATIRLLLQGGRLKVGGTPIEPLAAPELRQRAEALEADLVTFRNLSFQRFYRGGQDAGIGSTQDQSYDEVFIRILKAGEDLRAVLEERWLQSQAVARNRLRFIIAAWALLVVAAVFALWQRERGHKRSEDQLRTSRQWLATTLQSIGDGVITTDLTGTISFMNPVATKLTGWSDTEAVGQPIFDVFRISREDGGEVRHPVLEIMQGKERADLTNNTLLLSRGGERHFIDHTATPIRIDRWNFLGIVLVFRDVTRHKRAEAALRQREAELREAQKMEAVGRLAGGVAHDINNYLGAIRGYCEVAKMKAESGAALERRMDDAIETTHSVSTLVKRLLAFSRRHTGEARVVDIHRVIAGLDSMMHHLLGEDIELSTDLEEGLTVEIDPSQLEQILINLLVNARDAMLRGGEIDVSTRRAEIGADDSRGHQASKPGTYVLLAVSDTGSGIAPEVREKIFEPFFTTKDDSNRSGLGLATVYGITQQYGGFIAVDTLVGRGTTFKIYLPASDRPAEDVVSSAAGKVPVTTTPAMVLLVEDNEAMRAATHDMLEALGHAVKTATNGKEALDFFTVAGGEIDLVLTDVVMPGLSGPELMKQLREKRPELPCLFMSGYTDSDIQRHGFSQDRGNFLAKPFEVAQLAAKLTEILTAP